MHERERESVCFVCMSVCVCQPPTCADQVAALSVAEVVEHLVPVGLGHA